MKRITIIPGELFFKTSTRSISGEAIPGTLEPCGDYLIQKRRLPKIDHNFEITKETYERWEVINGNHSFFFESKLEAELAALEHIGV